jgi:hypothetical protein
MIPRDRVGYDSWYILYSKNNIFYNWINIKE